LHGRFLPLNLRTATRCYPIPALDTRLQPLGLAVAPVHLWSGMREQESASPCCRTLTPFCKRDRR
jgi:hypothetical protein